MNRRMRITGGWLSTLMLLWPLGVSASLTCSHETTANLSVDAGHAWQPPFGMDRVGSPPVVHVELATKAPPASDYFITTYAGERETGRKPLTFHHDAGTGYPTTSAGARQYYAHLRLDSRPTAVALYVACDGQSREVARQVIAWPEIDADAVARPEHAVNPVDLGTVLVPHDWLLIQYGQAPVVTVTAFSYAEDHPKARVRAWFADGAATETPMPIARGERGARKLKIKSPEGSDRTVLHVRIVEGPRELWRKDIPTMIVAKPAGWPKFGAVETKLRYDAPIVITDPEDGGLLPSIDYRNAWPNELNDVIVCLPNGSRFVFWRGSSYIPFWAGNNNTGVSYQWAETMVPQAEIDKASKDPTLEPLFDKELRYSRVHIVESSASRVHVRWTYQLPDYKYRVWGDQASEDFYFYPDGFGTRVLTVHGKPGAFQQLSEFIVLTPQAAYPLEILPSRMLRILSLNDATGADIQFPVETPVKPLDRQSLPRVSWASAVPRWEPTIFRVFMHKDDEASAVYFHPRDVSAISLFPPFHDKGQLVTPVYWGNHWPLSRGGWTETTINDRIGRTPSHNSIGGPIDGPLPWYQPPSSLYDSISQLSMVDALGRSREMEKKRISWLIAYTDIPDDSVRDWGKSFSAAPSVDVRGARLADPAYSPERRAIRLIAEQQKIEVSIRPRELTINPVLEFSDAPKNLAGVTRNGQALDPRTYAWDGKTLWVETTVTQEGAVLGLVFR